MNPQDQAPSCKRKCLSSAHTCLPLGLLYGTIEGVFSMVQSPLLQDLGGECCVAVVSFRFTHQPEWMQEGARFVVRDCTESCTAGAGVIRRLLPGA